MEWLGSIRKSSSKSPAKPGHVKNQVPASFLFAVHPAIHPVQEFGCLHSPYTSKCLLRRYLDPPNPPQTPSQKVLGGLGSLIMEVDFIRIPTHEGVLSMENAWAVGFLFQVSSFHLPAIFSFHPPKRDLHRQSGEGLNDTRYLRGRLLGGEACGLAAAKAVAV